MSAEPVPGPAPKQRFKSILCMPGAPEPVAWTPELALYHDLNLDQIIDAAIAGREPYELREFFYAPLDDVAEIEYRHEVFRDLEDPGVHEDVRDFAAGVAKMREHLQASHKHGYEHQQKRWFLAAASDYCAAVCDLAARLDEADVRSQAMTALGGYLADYSSSDAFIELRDEVREVEAGLAGLTYGVEILGDRVRVQHFHDEPDYSAQVAAAFEKFRQGAVKSHLAKFPSYADMDHVEGQILERVAQLFPEQFGALDRFCSGHASFADPVVLAFDREVQFYLAWLDYLAPIRQAGLSVAYPSLSAADKSEAAAETFDLALAAKLVRDGVPVITNDYRLDGPERMIVVSGPNQGGKTTFARTVGQLHYLAKLGLPLPGRDVTLLLCDRVFTHFERPENLQDLVGKLHDDLLRIHSILDKATPRSVVILNEIFTSTTMQDALFLSKEILSRLMQLDAVSVCVTFLEQLSTLGPATVSMVSTVRPEDPATRTFKVVRQQADGRAYALAIAERYGLTYDQLKGRLADGDGDGDGRQSA